MFQRLSTILLAVSFLMMGISKAHAQSAQTEGFQKAEKLYKAGDYYSAIAYYNDYISGKASKIVINSFTGYLSKPVAKKQEVIANRDGEVIPGIF